MTVRDHPVNKQNYGTGKGCLAFTFWVILDLFYLFFDNECLHSLYAGLYERDYLCQKQKFYAYQLS
jgi:hypothetical protein